MSIRINQDIVESIAYERGFEVLDSFKSTKLPIMCRCLKCNNTSLKQYSALRNGDRCIYCTMGRLNKKDLINELLSYGCKIPDLEQFRYDGVLYKTSNKWTD